MPYQLVRTNSLTRGQPELPQSGAVLLCDTSSSMNAIDTPGGVKRRIDHLAEILAGVLSRIKVRRLITFDSYVREVPLSAAVHLETPSGGTALELALDFIAALPNPAPSQLLIITDGVPNSEPAALVAMDCLQRRFRIPVHCYHCGADQDRGALAFLQELARHGGRGSTAGKFNLAEPKLVSSAVVRLLGHG